MPPKKKKSAPNKKAPAKRMLKKRHAPVGAELARPDLNSRLDAIERKLAQVLEALAKAPSAPAAPPAPSRPAAAPAFSAPTGADGDTAQFLSRTPLFAKLSPQECAVLASHCESKQVEAGSIVFAEGDFGDAMYIVKQGSLNIFKKDLLGDVRIAEIRPGGLVGEMALVDGKPRSANVRANEASRLLSLSRASYNDLKKSYPQVATKFQDELLLLISSRLRQTTEKLVGK
jgi:CRP/FNR family cyclic AMP-dependent transcriptional regulator